MTPDELAAIRKRDAQYIRGLEAGYYRGGHPEDECAADRDRRALLAHIDAITEAVEGLRPIRIAPNAPMLDRAAVLALLRGTPR